MSAPNYDIINRAFSKQAEHYDQDDIANPILKEWRQQVYAHVNRFLKSHSIILELNAGTGIDALHFARDGHRVHAIDIADGMVEQLQKKTNKLPSHLTCQQLSFEELNKLFIQPVDCIFSNFGGLNCTDDLTKITKHVSSILKPGGHVIWVIMPPFAPWEWLGALKGNGRKAFRRLNKDGTLAHLEGEYFKTFYYTLSDVKKALGEDFKLVACEGLGSVSPPPSGVSMAMNYPGFYKFLRKTDRALSRWVPFNRWADHLIVTFRFGEA